MLRDGASFRRLASLIGLKYLHQPPDFLLNILTLTCNFKRKSLFVKVYFLETLFKYK